MAEPKFTLASPTEQDLERFHSKYICGLKPDDCYTWLAGVMDVGYGHIGWRVNGGHRTIPAQRIAYFLGHNEDPGALYVLHRCDNPLCVNPHHLFLGTHLDNMRDKIQKGRQLKGRNHGMSKITEHDVEEMRQRHKASGLSMQAAAKMLAPDYPMMSWRSIEAILQGRLWQNLNSQPLTNAAHENSLKLREEFARGGKAKGSDLPKAKVTEEDVIEMRRRFEGSNLAVRQQARLLQQDYPQLTAGYIEKILHGRYWKHVLAAYPTSTRPVNPTESRS